MEYDLKVQMVSKYFEWITSLNFNLFAFVSKTNNSLKLMLQGGTTNIPLTAPLKRAKNHGYSRNKIINQF